MATTAAPVPALTQTTSDPTSSSISASPNSSVRRERVGRDRIDDILEQARNRKLDMGSNNEEQRKSRNGLNGIEIESDRIEESSADEETNILRQRSKGDGEVMNYQSTSVAGSQKKAKSIRDKQSTSSIRRVGRVLNPSQADIVQGDGELDDSEESWWARLLSDYGSIELENKGSVARDHLALERTFLAWLRTSLAFASIGIAITQLFRLNTSSSPSQPGDPSQHLRQMGKPLGATFLAISIVMLFVGFHRYFESQHWIIRGKFPASRGSIVLVAGITFALMVTSLVVVVVVEPGRFEKR